MKSLNPWETKTDAPLNVKFRKIDRVGYKNQFKIVKNPVRI